MKTIIEFASFSNMLAINGAAISMFGTTHQATVRPFMVPQTTQNVASSAQSPTYTVIPQPGYSVGYYSCFLGGGSGFTGLGVRYANRYWKAGQWTNSSTTFTDDTTDAQSSTASDFPIETTTNNDGCVIASASPFNFISMNIGTANGGTAPVRVLEYSIAAGWSSAATIYVNNTVALSTGEAVWLWDVWPDWAPMTSVHGTNIPLGYYGVRLRATTAAGTTAAVASAVEIGRLHFSIGAGVANGTVNVDFGAKAFHFPPEGDGIVAYIQTAASAPARFTALWKHS